MTSRVEPKRSMGFLGGMGLVLGCIIGSGIFVSPKGVLLGSGSVGLSMLVWLVGGGISMCGALSFVELGTLIPKSGGQYTYLLHSTYPVFAFLSCYVSVFVSKPASMSILSLTCAKYLLVPLYNDGCGDPPEVQVKLLAIFVILVVGYFNCKSGTTSNKIMIILTFGKFIALIMIILGGLCKLLQGSTKYLENSFEGTNTNAGEVALGLFSSMWAYEGWNLLNDAIEELKDPTWKLPQVIVVGMPIVTMLYILTNISYLTVLSPTDLIESPAVAITWADRVIPQFSWLIPICVAMSTFGSAYSLLFSAGRITYSAGREKHMFKILSMLDVEACVPTPAMLLTVGISCVMVIPSNIGSLIEIFVFVTWTIYGFVFACLLYLRYSRPNDHRPYKVSLAFPVLALLMSIFIVVAPIVMSPKAELLYSVLFILSGLLFYIPFVGMGKELPGMGRLTTWLQLLLHVSPPDSRDQTVR